ncbi:hypothetical protein GLOTRDRAFT_133468 [Gloeophyllum trabeum ATCC 11539]|uniref:F-box domain-containing protein n=1 Tax=Gloeophyllum trabeum (strain ATCC 11539 / FP-39264 / Madison 617) TaxID=670483 RepID=S7RF70_GLOTA|nr:uncharacterized protein GLOTRDRAFT_133468 [Gloeophyllum trabeum ATCC 11539]EPQ51149.1 hypothetical protein GLOTRDRAFT_133468 [Gloeophyllum trabeum ATCC 11539]
MSGLQSLIKRHVAPIDTVPVELVSDIMNLSLPPQELRHQGWEGGSPWSHPLRLAGVSRRWKVVAEDTPQLWCYIEAELKPSTSNAIKHLTKRWMSRSGSASLSVIFTVSRHSERESPCNDVEYMVCFDFLQTNMHRIRELVLRAPVYVLSTLPSAPLPRLETVRLVARERDDILALKETSIFAAAPKLRNIYIKGISRALGVRSFSWSSLTDLHLEVLGPALMPCVELLAACYNLLSLTLTMQYLTREHTAPWCGHPRPRLRCEKLHTLDVDATYSFTDFGAFVQWHFFPALRRLTEELLALFRVLPDLRILQTEEDLTGTFTPLTTSIIA